MKKDYKLIILLLALDQLLKLVISTFFIETKFSIIKGYVSFLPTHNHNYSYIGSLLNVNTGKILNTIIAAFCIFIVYYLYRFSLIKYKETRLINAGYFYFLSGGICSLIDRVFWSGSLDFISLEGLFVFDLKDCFLLIGSILIALEMLRYIRRNPKKWYRTTIKEEIKFIKEFIIFIKNDILNNLRLIDIINKT